MGAAFMPVPLDWILARSRSCFCDVIRARREAGDGPRDPAKAFDADGMRFGLVEFSGDRWLVLAIDPTLRPAPTQGRLS